MRILHLADLHYNLPWYDWLETQSNNYDVLVIAGDLLDMFATKGVVLPQQAREVQARLKRLPKPTVICSGNHDVWPSHPMVTTDVLAEGKWIQLCKHTGQLIVDGQTLEIEGERIEAVKWPIADWSKDSSILVMHCPPAGSPVGAPAPMADSASVILAERLVKREPAMVLCGHIHDADAWVCRVNETLCFNPGYGLDEKVPNYILIDTQKKTAFWHSDWRTSERDLAAI